MVLKVHLSTTDPAANVLSTVGEAVVGLEVSRIDPAAATRAYVDHVLETSGAGLDAGARALLEEDLRSPCTQEIAVFQAFSRTVAAAKRSFVVLDTAPTGHTLLLLDATGSYHRDVMRNASKGPGRVITPLMRLQDPAYTKVLVVALPETTPITEAERLQADLRRAGIEPWAWVLNRSLAAADPSDPVLRARAALEIAHIERVRRWIASRVTVLPWVAEPPIGPASPARAHLRNSPCAPLDPASSFSASGTRRAARWPRVSHAHTSGTRSAFRARARGRPP